MAGMVQLHPTVAARPANTCNMVEQMVWCQGPQGERGLQITRCLHTLSEGHRDTAEECLASCDSSVDMQGLLLSAGHIHPLSVCVTQYSGGRRKVEKAARARWRRANGYGDVVGSRAPSRLQPSSHIASAKATPGVGVRPACCDCLRPHTRRGTPRKSLPAVAAPSRHGGTGRRRDARGLALVARWQPKWWARGTSLAAAVASSSSCCIGGVAQAPGRGDHARGGDDPTRMAGSSDRPHRCPYIQPQRDLDGFPDR